ncbi:MAG: GspJ family T2SS minor pseudopilin variant LspJ [Legionella sp.]|nr:GspJ family T2SS minor pseudopilin variant LspJ [Legionella sp.]
MNHSNLKTKTCGFTLIELLIALMIFAILATITASTLYYAFNNRARVNIQAKRLSTLQLAIGLIQQDCLQAQERAIRTNNMQLIPEFVGRKNYFELTREGNINPQSMEKRSTLRRIALLCVNNHLIHRTWPSLDPIHRGVYEDRVLLENLSNCHFNYLNQSLQLLPEWHEQALTQDQTKELLPKAVQVNLTLNDWGKMSLLFAIPRAVYASN